MKNKKLQRRLYFLGGLIPLELFDLFVSIG